MFHLPLFLSVSVRFIRLSAFNQLLISALAGLTLDLKRLILRRDSLFMPVNMIHSFLMHVRIFVYSVLKH